MVEDVAQLDYTNPYEPKPSKPWYKSFWKVLLLAILVFVLIIGVLFGLLVYSEYRKISSGEPSTFANTNQDTNVTDISNLNFVPGVDDDPAIGSVDAAVTIIAFEDYQCPFCQEAELIIQELLLEYPEDILFVYRDFPLYTIHPQGQPAALAANCAGEQGQYWEYHDALYANQSALSQAGIYEQLADQLGMDAENFSSCVTSERYKSEVQADQDEGLLADVDSTPTWFVNGVKYTGVLSLEQWRTVVDYELSKQTQ